jgi:hypothetical protein
MRRLFLLTLLLALTLTPAADAVVKRGADDYAADRYLVAGDALSLARGRGTAVIRARNGAVLGTLARGRIVITDYQRGPETEVGVSGCEVRKRLGPRTWMCRGVRLGFSVLYGSWRILIRGRGINASARVTGSSTLEGTAGTYSVNGGPRHPWPEEARTFELGL